jgi:hypothetical protein
MPSTSLPLYFILSLVACQLKVTPLFLCISGLVAFLGSIQDYGLHFLQLMSFWSHVHLMLYFVLRQHKTVQLIVMSLSILS